MNYVIKDSALKKVLTKFGVDLTGKIHIVTHFNELPIEFRFSSRVIVNNNLNEFGPMFVIETPDNKFLYQNRDSIVRIYDNNREQLSEGEVLDILGVPPVGISLDDVIDTFYEE